MTADQIHRQHAIIEQVHADLKNSVCFIRNLIETAARQRDLRLFSISDGTTPDVSALTGLTATDIQAAADTLAGP